MPKTLVRFADQNGRAGWGLIRKDMIVSALHPVSDVADIFRRNADLDWDDGHPIPLADRTILSPLSAASKLVCQGLNYRQHKEDAGHGHTKGQNLFFPKDSSSICGPNDDVVRPEGCVLLDFEIELGLVLRRDISGPIDITNQNLGQYIGGLVICNDVSARDAMFGASFMQFYAGKSYRTFCPIGPYLVYIEENEAALIDNLELKLWHNGELRQHAHTEELVHKPAETLSALSRIVDMKAGDCLLTGTPGGTITTLTPGLAKTLASQMFDDVERTRQMLEEFDHGKAFLQPGDELRLSIQNPDGTVQLGEQNNRIVAPV